MYEMPTFDTMQPRARRWIGGWLLLGAFLVLMQVMIGGITRLTDSGLSITEWEVIDGTLPPLNEADWNAAFESYKTHARKQFESLHADMTLAEFKVIYFWEWFHRLWARMMGFAFLIPFIVFAALRWFPRWLLWRLGGIIGLASLAGVLGWFMVASGLNNDDRTWVNAYNLISHLGIATLLFAFIVHTAFLVFRGSPLPTRSGTVPLRRLANILIAVTFVQIMAGGLMAGMRAGLIHPHWPLFAGSNSLIAMLGDGGGVAWSHFIDYEPSRSVKAIVQLLHRGLAVVVSVLVVVFFIRSRNYLAAGERWLVLLVLAAQYILGVWTVISCVGSVPVTLGVVHQVVAIILFGALVRGRFAVLNAH